MQAPAAPILYENILYWYLLGPLRPSKPPKVSPKLNHATSKYLAFLKKTQGSISELPTAAVKVLLLALSRPVDPGESQRHQGPSGQGVGFRVKG